jgi:phage terminase large subunit
MIKNFPIYYPLYQDKEKFIILVTGGRGSGKSYATSAFIERLTFEMTPIDKIVHQILYTRYTMVSAHMSVIPEFMEKVEMDGTEKYFSVTKTDVINKMTKSRIMFRGIKVSSGVQTAKLKSIHGITTFVCDEAEEWTNEQDFEKIMLSIRQKGIQNRIIIIMNPCDSNHFIYKKYIEKTHKLVEIDGVQVQISTHPNVLHIHTTYFDNLNNLSPEFLREVEDMKVNNPEKYAHVVIGRWADVAEGAVFKKWGIVKEFPTWAKKVALASDWGYTNDPSTGIRCGIVDNRLYVDELFYETGMLTNAIAEKLKPWGLKVYGDSADPRLIQEIKNRGVNIYPVDKFPGSIKAGIDKIHEMELFVTERSYHIIEELRKYVWDKDKDGHYINSPVDANNHCFRGDTLITTINGDVPIKDVKEGDFVLTRKGYKKVLKKHCNGVKKVVEKELIIDFEKRTFFATLEHKFNVNGKWKKYGDLTKKDKLFILSPSMEENIIVTNTENTPITTSIAGIRMGRKKGFTMRFMNIIRVRFLKEWLCIILTLIHLITKLITWFSCQEQNICGYMMNLGNTERNTPNTCQKSDFRAKIGTKDVFHLKKNCKRKDIFVSNVEKSLFHVVKLRNIVRPLVISIGKIMRSVITLNLNVLCAVKSLLGTNIENLKLAHLNVHSNWQSITDVKINSESYCEVYDLTIEDEHEYFANGVLVHNCIDPIRYYILGHILGRILKPKDLTGIFNH